MQKTIILVEDNQDIREIISFLLEEEQYEVVSCEDAKSFRAQIFQRRPDMVILDVMLPDGNGIDLCCEVKSDYRTGHIPVLMMSAHSSLRDIRQQCQADQFIKKPFDINHLIDTVSGLIQKRARSGNI